VDTENVKSPMEMNYEELNILLDSFLAAENLPSIVAYHDSSIHYRRQQRLRMLLKALHRLLQAQSFYMKNIKKQFKQLKKIEDIYDALKENRCLKNQRTYFYLSKIGLSDLARQIGGHFDDELFANFNLATMLYDASFDVPQCRKYLKMFDTSFMEVKRIESSDDYLRIFQNCVDAIEKKLDPVAIQLFNNYVKIEHISQLMSIYQISDKYASKEDIMKITYAKGGMSALILMHLMVPTMNQKQRKAIYELGAVMQLIDDISDIKEDLKIGIRTLPNQKLLSFDELKSMYFGAVNNLMKTCEMDSNCPNETLDMLCWFTDIILEKRYRSFQEIYKV